MTTKITHHGHGQLSLPSDLGRDVLDGEILIRDPVNVYEGNLPTSSSDVVYGVIDDINGGEAAQTMPLRLMRVGERRVRIQDNATVADRDLLSPSSSDTGSAAPQSLVGGRPFARALEAITSGGTAQYVQAAIECDIGADGLPATAVGTAGTGVTAAESVLGPTHRTTLTVATVLDAIAGGADLAVGNLLYTFPSGLVLVDAAKMALSITQTEGNITADTPDGGLGTVKASGVVAVLSGTGTFEDLLTGQTFDDCNGTVESIALGPTAGSPFVIAAAAAHTVHFNVADGWAASGDTAALLAGTVTLDWRLLV